MKIKSIVSSGYYIDRKSQSIQGTAFRANQLLSQNNNRCENFTHTATDQVSTNNSRTQSSYTSRFASKLQEIRNFSIVNIFDSAREYLQFSRLIDQANAIDEIKDIYRL